MKYKVYIYIEKTERHIRIDHVYSHIYTHVYIYTIIYTHRQICISWANKQSSVSIYLCVYNVCADVYIYIFTGMSSHESREQLYEATPIVPATLLRHLAQAQLRYKRTVAPKVGPFACEVPIQP